MTKRKFPVRAPDQRTPGPSRAPYCSSPEGRGPSGQAFVRHVLETCNPGKVIVFSRDEQKHYAMQSQLSDKRLRFFVGDIRDRDRLMRALSGVDIVVHAAAMKTCRSPSTTRSRRFAPTSTAPPTLIDAALERNVSRLVALSTDKAVSPVNLYGATKLCMEKLLVAANSYGAKKSRFDLVRYGNVVGSKGSVVPLFRELRQKGMLTLTDPKMTRFWIGMNRAVGSCCSRSRKGAGVRSSSRSSPACSVETLAEAMAPGVERQVVGIRPGEKIHETPTLRPTSRATSSSTASTGCDRAELPLVGRREARRQQASGSRVHVLERHHVPARSRRRRAIS